MNRHTIACIVLVFGLTLSSFSIFILSSFSAEETLADNTAPEMIRSIPDVMANEDSFLTCSFDLKDYFTDDITNSTVLDYDIELRGDNSSKISVMIVSNRIAIDPTITPNFHTDQKFVSIEGRISATDSGDIIGSNQLTNHSNWFGIDIIPINDLPVRTGNSLDDLWVWEGSSMNVTDLDDHDLFNDVDGDSLRYFLQADLSFDGYDESAGFRILWSGVSNQLKVIQNQNTNFTGEVPIRLYCYDGTELNFMRDPYLDFILEVRNTDDAPVRTTHDPGPFHIFEGMDSTLFNMSNYDLFYDGDNDTLKYLLIADYSSPEYEESVEFLSFWRGSTGMIEFQLNTVSDWTGEIPLKIYCTDQNEFNINKDPFFNTSVVIDNVNDPSMWKEIDQIFLSEDTPSSGFIDLSKWVTDIDTPILDLEFSLDSYTNHTFFQLLQESIGDPTLSFEPVVDNWFGNSTVNISVDDGEFSVSTQFHLEVTPVNDLPGISITSPREDDRIQEEVFSVVGTAFDVEGIDRVEVHFEGQWIVAMGKGDWGVTLHTPEINESMENVPIIVRVIDSEYGMDYDYVNITIIPLEHPPLDWDRDGVPDSEDAFPHDRSASVDADLDGHPDNWNPGMGPEDSNSGLTLDDLPSDPLEWSDRDKDGHGDNGDAFPDNKTEWADQDGDGVGDNSDEFPNDPHENSDMDGDGEGDNEDGFPTDPAASVDEDLDGYPDRWNPGMNKDDSTSDLELDHYPDDPMKWEKEGFFEKTSTPLLILLILIPILFIGAIISTFLYYKNRSKGNQVVPIMEDEDQEVFEIEE